MGEQFSDQPQPPIQPRKLDTEADIPLEEGYVLLNAGHTPYGRPFVDKDHLYEVNGQVFGAIHLPSVYDHPLFANQEARAALITGVAAELSTDRSSFQLELLAAFAKNVMQSGSDVQTNPMIQKRVADIRASYGRGVVNAQSAWAFLQDPRIAIVESDDLPAVQMVGRTSEYSGKQVVENMRRDVGRYLSPADEVGKRDGKSLEPLIDQAIQAGLSGAQGS